jgi:hypothetical protein
MQTPIVHIIQEVANNTNSAIIDKLQDIEERIFAVHFDYGHPSEIIARVASKSRTAVNRIHCYPLIGLFLDFPEETTGRADLHCTATLHLFICHATSNKFTSQERTDRTFIPILYPILETFINQLVRHPLIVEKNYSSLKYTKTDRYKWGTGGIEYYKDGIKNTFNDYLDAIEITGLKLGFKKEC